MWKRLAIPFGIIFFVALGVGIVNAALPYWTPAAKECARFQPSPANVALGTSSYTDIWRGTTAVQVFTPLESYSIGAIKLNYWGDTSTNPADHSGAAQKLNIAIAPLGANGFPQKFADVTYSQAGWTYSNLSIPTPLSGPDGSISGASTANGWAEFACSSPYPKTSLQAFPNPTRASGQFFQFVTPVAVVAATPYAMVINGDLSMSASAPVVGGTLHGNNDSYSRGVSMTCGLVGGSYCLSAATATPSGSLFTTRNGDYGFALYAYPSEFGTPTPIPTIVGVGQSQLETDADSVLGFFNAATQWGYVFALVVVTLAACAGLNILKGNSGTQIPALIYGIMYTIFAIFWCVLFLDYHVALAVLVTIPIALAGGTAVTVLQRRGNSNDAAY